MEWAPVDILNKQFRTRWRGYDPQEVEVFLQQIGEEMQQLQIENANLRKETQRLEKELKEYKDREKVIRNVLVSTQKAVEQMKANAEKEAKLILADAEMNAEKMLQGAQQKLSRLYEEVADLKGRRVQLTAKLRATIEAYQRLLESMDEEGEDEPATAETAKAVGR